MWTKIFDTRRSGWCIQSFSNQRSHAIKWKFKTIEKKKKKKERQKINKVERKHSKTVKKIAVIHVIQRLISSAVVMFCSSYLLSSLEVLKYVNVRVSLFLINTKIKLFYKAN